MSEIRGNGWICEFTEDGIVISSRTRQHGIYNILSDPHCSICAFPGVRTEECPWPHDPRLTQTIAMGVYYPYRSEEHNRDLLTQHIMGVKRYVNYAKPLGLSMALTATHVYNSLEEFDALVSVPKHPSEYEKDWETGERYNQAFRLARIVGKEIGKPLMGAVTKSRPWSQRGRSIRERIDLPDDLYHLTKGVEVRGKSMLLIDDVCTSGGSAVACARALLDGGARKVCLFVAGRDGGSEKEE